MQSFRTYEPLSPTGTHDTQTHEALSDCFLFLSSAIGSSACKESTGFPPVLLRAYAPQMTWSSIAIAHNVQASDHVDAANCPHSWNMTIALGDFQGGGLLVEDRRGNHVLDNTASSVSASSFDNHDRAIFFRPAWRHASLPWRGDRWSITCLRMLMSMGLGVRCWIGFVA